MKFYYFISALLILLVNFEEYMAENLELLILHNNDMHSRFEETSILSGTCKNNTNCYGGFARVLHVIRKARKEAQESKGPHVLYLNAGDTFTGTVWFSVHKDKIVTDFLNLLRPDAASFGNHEFDLGVNGVLSYINAAQFPIVAANLDFSAQPNIAKLNVTKSHVLEIAGRKIGIIGYLTKQTIKISSPEKIKFIDEVEAIKKESERLDKEGVKIIIALGHSGYQTDKRIASDVPLVDLVVGGHTNTFLWNGPKPDNEEPEGPYPTVVTQSSGKKVPVVQAYAYTKYMGHLKITFNDNGDVIQYSGQPQLLNSTVPQDKDALDLLEKYRPKVIAFNKEIVGKTRVTLDGTTGSCRKKECNFANLITDAFVSYHSALYAGTYWTDAPIALTCGGSLRNSIELSADGSITRGELLGVMPFDNQLISMDLNGTDLLKTLEIGVASNGDTSYGEFIQSSGVHYRIDKSRPAGSRIVDVKVRCGACKIPIYQPLVLNQTYRIITISFLSSGGDGHTILKDNGRNKVVEDLNDLDTVVWYIKKTSPIYPEEEERIIVAPKKEDGSSASSMYASVCLVTLVLFLLSCTR